MAGMRTLIIGYGSPIRGDDAPPTAGDRAPALDMTFPEAIAAIAGDRPRVLVVARDGSGLSGELRSVGRDVATLRLADAESRKLMISSTSSANTRP